MESRRRRESGGKMWCGYEDEDPHLTRNEEDEDVDKSFSNGVLPRLGRQSNSRPTLIRCSVISPFNYYYRLWETFLILLVFYTAWVCPFEFGFLDNPHGPLAITDNIVNGFFAIDIVVMFFVAYLDKVTYSLVDDQKKIAWKYTKTWLTFDVISIIPYELARKYLPRPLQSYGYFNMLRLWRLRRVSKMFARLEKDMRFNYFWVRCAKLLFVTIFSTHLAGCFFYLIATQYRDPKRTWIGAVDENFHEESLWDQYVTSIYWSIATLSTTGYGDFHPVNPREMIFDIIYMLFNLGLTSYLIGNMTTLVVHGTSRTRKFRDSIRAVSSFAQRNDLPVRLHDQMLAHLRLRYKADSEGVQKQEILETLPKAIRSSISWHLFLPVFDNMYLFHGISTYLLFQLVSEMKLEYFPPNEDVILQNEAPTDLYFLVTGAVDLIVKKENRIEQVVGEAKPGDVCGEVGVICSKPQPFTIRTKRLSQLLRLNRTTFLSLVQANAEDGPVIMNNFLQHLKDINSKAHPTDGVLEETEHMIARGRMELPLSLCFAVMRGDDELFHQLLRRGVDPNGLDNNRRTPLHIAASKGSEKYVISLLEYGADPNSKDLEGNVPLWNAMLGTHKNVIKLLLEKGASLSSSDAAQFACTAVEQHNLDLLKEIVCYNGDITIPNTALRTAISQGHVEIVIYLLEQGVTIEKVDRDLAEEKGHQEIIALLQNNNIVESISSGRKPRFSLFKKKVVPYMGRLSSVPARNSFAPEVISPSASMRHVNSNRRRHPNSFNNALFEVMSGATGDDLIVPSASYVSSKKNSSDILPARVTLGCAQQGVITPKLVILPESLEELLEIGAKKFGVLATNVLAKDGAEIDDIEVIRDGDHLVLFNYVGDDQIMPSASYVSSQKNSSDILPARVTLGCAQQGEITPKLVLLPESLEELLEIGAKKFGVLATKVLAKDGAEIDDIEVIRDGDHLVLFSYVGGNLINPSASYVPSHNNSSSILPTRVILSCALQDEVTLKLVILPESLEELLEIGAKKFGVLATKVLTKDGAEIDVMEVIRDGDHLVLVSDIEN